MLCGVVFLTFQKYMMPRAVPRGMLSIKMILSEASTMAPGSRQRKKIVRMASIAARYTARQKSVNENAKVTALFGSVMG